MTAGSTSPSSLLRWADVAMLGRAAMEALWIGLWYATFFLPGGGREVELTCLVFWLILAISYELVQAMDRLRLKTAYRRWIFLSWLAVAGLCSLEWLLLPQPLGLPDLLALPLRSLTGSSPSPLPFLHLIGVSLLGLRGLALAHELVDIRAAAFEFQIGLVFILLYGISFLLLGARLETTGLELYLCLGLVTLGTTRISMVSASPGGRLPGIGPGWAAGLILGTGLVVGLGLLSGALAASQAGTLLARLVLAVIALVGLVLFIILLPVINVVLRGIISALATLSGVLNNPLLKSFQDWIEGVNRLADQTALRSQPWLHLLRVVVPALVLLGLLAIVFFWLRLRTAWQHLPAEEQEENLRLAGPADLWRQVQRRMDRRGLPGPAGLLAAARIRRIYSELLSLSARLGGPRPAHLTPLEFLPRLAEIFAGQEAGLEQITRAYLKVRYGEVPESMREVEEVEAAWKRIRFQGRTLRGKG